MATTYDKASLVMIPSGVKEDKLYSIKPTDGSGDFTFSRGSDIEATRVNSSGLIEKAKVNLLLQSNQFDTTWVATSGTSLTSGQSGYDGSSDAWLMTSDGVSGFAPITQNITFSDVKTFSVYAKEGTNQYITLRSLGATDVRAIFNLNTGALHSSSNTIATNITSIGSGWYRLEMVLNASNTSIVVYPNILGTASAGTILIQDAQLNHGLVAQDYVETTTTAVVEGLTADLPRLDYSGGASCPALLLEPQRTNSLTHSEYFGDWNVYRGSLTANDATSPEGVDNAYRYEENSDTGQHFVRKTISMTSGTTYTASAFVKADEITSVRLGSSSVANWNASATFNLSNGSVSSGTGTIEDYGNNWYRCIVTAACTTTATIGLEITTSSGAGSSGDGLYIYGAMIEAGSYATSYIPTYGTSAGRAAETCLDTNASSIIGQTEGTLFFECTNKALVANARYFSLSDGTGNNRIDIYHHSSDRIGIYVATAGAAQVNITNVDLPASGSFKFALAYANNDFVWYVNGTQIATDTSASVPAMSHTLLGTGSTGTANGGNNPFKQALLFKTRLTNAELAALTA